MIVLKFLVNVEDLQLAFCFKFFNSFYSCYMCVCVCVFAFIL